MPEQRIPMFESTPRSLPGIEEMVFHVKHSPVEKLASSRRGAFQKTERIGIDQLQRQQVDELGDAVDSLTGNPYFEFTGLAMTAHAEGDVGIAGESSMDDQRIGIVADGMTKVAGAEGASHAQYMDAFEQTRLAAAIGPADKIDPRPGSQVDRFKVAQALEGKTIKRHEGIR